MSRSTGSLRPRHSSMPKGFTNLEWFQPELLRHLDDKGVGVALESIQQFIRPDTLGFVLETALGLRGCTELLLSCESTNFSGAAFFLTVHALLPSLALSQDRFSFVLNWVDNVFPHNLGDYSPKAICPTLLSTISISLLFLSPNADDLPQDLNVSHQYVVLSNSVLQALVTIFQSSEIDGGLSDKEATKRKKGTQKAQKPVRKGRQMTKPVDSTPFRALHLDVPTSHDEAKEMALGILSRQKDILMVMLPSPMLTLRCHAP